MVKRATGRELKNFTVETQKELKAIETGKRGIRLDILVSVTDVDGRVNELPELISIWILTYDPFGTNRMLYTVKNIVTDNPDLKYSDGVTNLFLYTEGTVGGSKELKQLLKHMTNTTIDNALDSDLKQIQKREQIKQKLTNKFYLSEADSEEYLNKFYL